MNKSQMKIGMAYFNCTINFVRTGHPRYVRGFVLDERGVTLGRITVLDGVYNHVKWYGGYDRNTYLIHGWNLYKATGGYLQHAIYLNLYEKAVAMSEAKKAGHQAWRDANPKFDAEGKLKKRCKLSTPRVFPFLCQLIREEGAIV